MTKQELNQVFERMQTDSGLRAAINKALEGAGTQPSIKEQYAAIEAAVASIALNAAGKGYDKK